MAQSKFVERTFKRDDLQALLWEDLGEDDGYTIIKNEMYDTSRWSIHYELIFKFEDKFYMTCYSRGATESQDEQPWEYDGENIPCTEVTPTEVTVIEYKAIPING